MKITLNPDQEIVQTIREGLKRTGGYCPCRLERTETLISLLSQQKFRRSLRNLLPLETTSDMPQNNLIFDADFSFNDGQDYLYFQSSFGQLNLFSTTGNNLMLCTTSRQKEFLQQVYDIISAEP